MRISTPTLASPAIAWIAHVDTSPETSGAGVKPIVHRSYAGGDIVLPGDTTKVIRVVDNPELAALQGKTLVTTDGTTLLGADDKAGIAVIMEAVAHLLAHPEAPHGPIRICFTCDEEIGHGVDHLDLKKLGARVYGLSLPPPTQPNLHELIASAVFAGEVQADVRDMGALEAAVRKFDPEVIFHLAAQPLVRRSYAEPLAVRRARDERDLAGTILGRGESGSSVTGAVGLVAFAVRNVAKNCWLRNPKTRPRPQSASSLFLLQTRQP